MKRFFLVVIGLLLMSSFVGLAQSQQTDKSFLNLEKQALNFGEISMGNAKTMLLKFTNTGKKTLILFDVYTNCGCTTVDWPKDPFAPGKSGEIKVTYNPTEEGAFNKTIYIYSNASNKQETVKIEGFVIEK